MTAFTSVQSGDWDDGLTWGTGSGGDYPGKTTDDDTVIIGSGDTVNYNIDNSTAGTNHRIRSIYVGQNETLTWATDRSTHLWIGGSTNDCIQAQDIGTLKIGTLASPLSSAYTCTIEVDQSSDGANNIIDLGNNGDTLFYGATKTIKGYTNATLTANTSTSISMSAVPSDWAVGDEILIQSTSSSNTQEYDEIITIDSKTATTISFSDGAGTGGAVLYDHVLGCILLNLTRNIRFISKTSTSRANRGIYASACNKVELHYVEFRNCTNGDRGGAWNVNTQNGTTRHVRLKGCVTNSQGNDGSASPGSGTMIHEDCIFCYNPGQGFDCQNDSGFSYFENCYFVHNGSHGAKIDRGQGFFKDCQFWTNGTGIYNAGELYVYNCRLFGNNDAGISSSHGGYIYNCYFGESEVATQPNFNASKSENEPIRFHDCFFASGEDFQVQNNPGVVAYSSNHNQTASNYVVDYASSTQSIIDDTSTYRTTSPSIRMTPGGIGAYCMYEIPLQVESGTSYTVTIYGKKATTGAWKDPYARLLGCGLDDYDEFSVSDTNWNSISLTGTASRDGVAIITIVDFEDVFNIDDVTVS